MSLTLTKHRPSAGENVLPSRVRRALWRILPLIGGLYAYIGWRLLPALDLGTAGRVPAAGGQALSSCLVPFGLLCRFVVADQLLRPAQAIRAPSEITGLRLIPA